MIPELLIHVYYKLVHVDVCTCILFCLFCSNSGICKVCVDIFAFYNLYFTVKRTGRRRTYGSPGGAGAAQYGTDYSKGPTPAAVTVQQRPRPPPVVQPPVNAAPPAVDEPDTSSFSRNWSGTLRSSGGPRPWEQEQKEYIMPSVIQSSEQQQQSPRRPAPAVSPKPSRSPQPRKPAASPQRQIVVRSVPNDQAQQEQPPQDGGQAVHLQYNSPMGLYSNQNIEDTYNAQIGYPGQNT